MADTGFVAPTAASTTNESPWLDEPWVNAANIYGAGEASVTAATFDNGDQTAVLKAYGFDFSAIGDSDIIDGVLVRINARADSTSVGIDLVQLLDTSRAKVGTNRSDTAQRLTTGAANYDFGGSTDKFDNALTPAWVKDPDFGVAIGGHAYTANSQIWIDSVTITIYYHTPPVDKTLADSGAGTDALTTQQTATKSLEDSGAGADAQTIAATPALADSGAGSDAQTIAATLPIADSGAGVDALAIAETVAKALADSGSGDDSMTADESVPMKQYLFANNLNAGSSTQYGYLSGNGTIASFYYHAYSIVAANGTFRNLRVDLSAAPTSGKSRTITLYVNGSPTALTVTISDTATTGSDTTHSVEVNAGDKVCWLSESTGTPGISNIYTLAEFEGATERQSIIPGTNFGTSTSTTQTLYAPITGAPSSMVSSLPYKQIVAAPGTIKRLYAEIHQDPGTAPDAYRFTVQKNGSSTNLTCTIVADNVTGSDLNDGHGFTVSPGDHINILIEPVDTPALAVYAYWGVVFEPDTNGESLILGGSSSDLGNILSAYYIPPVPLANWGNTQYTAYKLHPCVLRDLYVELSGSPYANDVNADKYTFTLYKEGSDTALTCEIADGGTGNVLGNDTAHEITVSDGEYVNLKEAPSSSPTVRDAYWGMVMYIEPSIPRTISDSGSGTDAKTILANVTL